MTGPGPPDVRLRRSPDRDGDVQRLATAFGGPVGLEPVLDDLDLTGRQVGMRGAAPVWGFRWCDDDVRDLRWFPQGITSSADRGPGELVDGRPLLCVSWYYADRRSASKGARVSFVDLSDWRRPRYRHVLLVEATARADGAAGIRPVQVHAGGLVWCGPLLYAAATSRGLDAFRLGDILRVPVRCPVDTFGYRYVLPLHHTYDVPLDDAEAHFRYSFLSRTHGSAPPAVLAGEYAARGQSGRLAHFPVDPATGELAASFPDGHAGTEAGTEVRGPVVATGLSRMQGAVSVEDTYLVSTSAGRYERGSIVVGRPGALRVRERVTPVGPEDLTYWPSTDLVWAVTEYPGRRHVFAMERGWLLGR